MALSYFITLEKLRKNCMRNSYCAHRILGNCYCKTSWIVIKHFKPALIVAEFETAQHLLAILSRQRGLYFWLQLQSLRGFYLCFSIAKSEYFLYNTLTGNVYLNPLLLYLPTRCIKLLSQIGFLIHFFLTNHMNHHRCTNNWPHFSIHLFRQTTPWAKSESFPTYWKSLLTTRLSPSPWPLKICSLGHSPGM